MSNYNSIYTGQQIDAAVGAVTTAVGNGGIVSLNGVQTILEDYLTRYEEITATFLSTSADSGFITDQHGNFKHKRDTNTDYWQIQDNTGATKFSVYWETGIINCTNGIQYATSGGSTASTHWISAGGGYSTGSGKSGVKLICCEQNDCLSGLGQDCGGGPYELSIITGQQPSSATTAYIRFLRHDTTSTTYTKLAELNGSGTFTIGYRVTSTAPSALTNIDRLILVPYFHTGGPWKITSRDDATNSHLSLYYGSTEAIKVQHTKQVNFYGQIRTSFKDSVAVGSFGSSQSTVTGLLDEVRYSSGCMGSVSIGTAYSSIPTGWYNFIWVPHRSGGVNGAASGDNHNYGNLLLFGMTIDAANHFIVRYNNGSIQVRKI